MGYSQSFTSIFKGYFFVQSLLVTVGMCLNFLMMSIVGLRQLNQLVTFLAYLAAALIYTFIFCYLGDQLMDNISDQQNSYSADIVSAAYESSWTSWPVDLQKDLVIVMTVAQRSFEISAGGIANMSLETFSQILSRGFSVFTVLRDVVN